MKLFTKSLTLASVLLVSNMSIAGTTTWEWDLTPGSTGNSISSSCTYGCSTSEIEVTNTQGTETVTATMNAWADTKKPSSTDNDDPVITQSELYFWGNNNGWGAVNNDESSSSNNEHAFDNKGKSIDYDMALISFDTSVELTGIDFGFVSDGDFTLLAYDGNTEITNADLTNSTWAAQNNSGDWLTVGQYNGGVTDSYYSVNSGGVSSQYWLIGAYNSLFGASTAAGLDENDDAFKIRKLQGNTTEVSEVSSPGAFGLLLVGLSGIYFRRNKKS